MWVCSVHQMWNTKPSLVKCIGHVCFDRPVMLFLRFLSFGVGCNAPAAQASQDDVFAEVQPVVQEARSVVRQQPAVQFFALHGLFHTGSKVVHLWRSSKMEETAASCATARHQQDWLSIHFVIQFVMVHLERQDLHDRRWWGRCDLRAVWQIQCKKCSYDSYAKCREIYVESFPEPWKQPLGENHHEDRLWTICSKIDLATCDRRTWWYAVWLYIIQI